MNKQVKSLIIFLLGLTAGGAVGSIVTSVVLRKKCDEEVSRMKEYYKDKYSSDKNPGLLSEDEVETLVEYVREDVSPEIKEALLKDWNREPLIDPAESAHPVDSDEDEVDEDVDLVKEFEEKEEEIARDTNEFYNKNKNRPPKIISVNDISDLPPGFEEVEWSYYKFDQVLADENDEAVIDYSEFIGDALDKYDFRNNDEETLYVVSYKHSVIIEIDKLYLSFADKKEKNEQYFKDLEAYGYGEGDAEGS